MSLRIIGAGFGRTGTASLKIALDQIGYGPCYHMSEVLKNPQHIGEWMAAADGSPNWEDLFSAYQSCVDFPACSFYRELAAQYPDAKVILTVRDAESWFESVHETIMSPLMFERIATSPFGELNRKIIWSIFDNRLNDRDHMVRCFNEHADRVKATIPADRLLVYEVKQGWGPLCDFLGCDAPGTPFPRVNSREETRRLLEAMVEADDNGELDDARMADAARQLHGE